MLRLRLRSLKPETEERMDFISRRFTVCEVFRQIYKTTDNEEIKLNCRMGSSIAKLMAAELTFFKGKGWGQKFYPKNPLWKRGREIEADNDNP
jgi:hypothetical protein